MLPDAPLRTDAVFPPPSQTANGLAERGPKTGSPHHEPFQSFLEKLRANPAPGKSDRQPPNPEKAGVTAPTGENAAKRSETDEEKPDEGTEPKSKETAVDLASLLAFAGIPVEGTTPPLQIAASWTQIPKGNLIEGVPGSGEQVAGTAAEPTEPGAKPASGSLLEGKQGAQTPPNPAGETKTNDTATAQAKADPAAEALVKRHALAKAGYQKQEYKDQQQLKAVSPEDGMPVAKVTDMLKELEKQDQFAGPDRHNVPSIEEITQVVPHAAFQQGASEVIEAGWNEVVPVKAADIPHKLLDQINTHVSVMKSSQVGELSVLIQPEPATRVWLQLKNENGVIQISARCEAGDMGKLSTHWPELQRSLASQGIHLNTLGDVNGTPYANQSGQSGGGRDGGAGKPLWDAWWENPFPSQRQAGEKPREAALEHAGPGEGWQSWA